MQGGIWTHDFAISSKHCWPLETTRSLRFDFILLRSSIESSMSSITFTRMTVWAIFQPNLMPINNDTKYEILQREIDFFTIKPNRIYFYFFWSSPATTNLGQSKISWIFLYLNVCQLYLRGFNVWKPKLNSYDDTQYRHKLVCWQEQLMIDTVALVIWFSEVVLMLDSELRYEQCPKCAVSAKWHCEKN